MAFEPTFPHPSQPKQLQAPSPLSLDPAVALPVAPQTQLQACLVWDQVHPFQVSSGTTHDASSINRTPSPNSGSCLSGRERCSHIIESIYFGPDVVGETRK